MRKIYTLFGGLGLLLSSISLNAQVYVSEGFNASSTPPGWTATGFSLTTTSPCEGDRSMRRNFYGSNPTGSLTSPTQTATGNDIEVSFTYKVLDYAIPPTDPAPGDWGSINVDYSIDNGSTWITALTIDNNNHTPATTCEAISLTLNAADVPNGSDFVLRFDGSYNSGDYYVYIDDVVMIEQVACIQPSGLNLDNITGSTADISWIAGNTETSWNIEWGAPGFTPGNSEEAGSATTTPTPSYQITGLAELTNYEVYIQADCATDGVSAWAGPYSITTIALCPNVSSITQDAVSSNSLDLSWTPGGTEAAWDIEWGAPGFTPGNSDELGSDVSASPSYQITGLAPTTSYEVYVRADCDTDGTSEWVGPLSFTTIQVTVSSFPYMEDFEAGVGNWSLVNGTETNQWFVGSAVNNGGTNSIYISNDGGTSNAYTITSTTRVHAYRDIEFPASGHEIQLSLDWRVQGEGSYDNLRVWLVPTSYIPTAGTNITTTGSAPTGRINLSGNLNAQGSFVTFETVIPSEYFGTTARLVLGWRNDSSGGTQPPAAVDNIMINISNCPPVSDLLVDNITTSSGDLTWTAGGTETAWNIEWGLEGFNPGEGTMENVTGSPTHPFTGLADNETYDVYIQADCGGEVSNWVGPYSFTTIALCPVVSNITQDAITSTTADLSWTPGGTEAAWNIEWGVPGFTPGNSEEVGADISASPSYQITGLTADTDYEVYIQADCDTDGTSEWVGPFSIYTGYCVPTYTNTGDYTSSFVTLDAISNVTYSASSQPAGGYEDFSAGTPIISQADSTFNFTTAYVGGSNTFRIWVDWNNDFTFDDAEEVYLSSVSVATQSGSITIPNGTPSGDYRMRIRSRFYTTVPGACSSESFGSALDYTLRIIDPLVAPSLTQAGGTPDCATGTDLDATGTPDADIEWYWQSDADGTAMDNQYSGPYTVFANGTYYLRAYHTIYDFWSAASSIDVTNLPLAPTPPAPTAAQNPVCVPGTDISMPAPPADVTYYWQTVVDGVSTDSPADTPWNITETGTYYVSAFESTTNCWSSTSEITVTVDNQIPLAPLVTQDTYNICTGATSQIIEANAPASGQINEASGDININIPDNNSTGISSDLTVSGIPTSVTVDELFVTINIQHTFNGDLDIYLVGANGTEIELSTDNGGLGDNYVNTVFSLNGTNPITGATAPMTGTFSAEGDMSTLVTGLLNGTWTLKVIDDASGDLGVLRNWSIEIQYSAPVATVEWFDAATGGNSLGTNNTLETVGTSVLSNPATAGSYNFYASSVTGACSSDERTLVTINVDNVNVLVSPIDVTCNGGENGSFEITSIECGVEPLTYSVNGGAFGPIPTDLVAGTYTIVAQDDNGDVSSDVTITIAEPNAITDFSAEAIAFDQVELTWTTTGLEGEWVVEYGEAGFTPGTGTFVTVTNNPTVIDQLDENTEYDFYIQPSCAPGISGEQVGATSAITFCAPIAAAGWCEGFETDSPTLDCWTVLNENEDTDQWTLYTGYANSGTYSAGLYTDFNGGNNDDWLITPQVTLTGNEVLSFFYRVRSSSEPNDFRVLLSTTGKNPADFDQVLMDLSSYNNTTYEDTLINLSAYTGNVFIAFHVPSGGLDGYYLYIDDVCIDICTPQASQDGELDVCSLDETIDLNTIITPGETTGTWSFDVNPSALNGSTLTVDALPAGTYQAMYTVQTFCPAEADTAYATINLYGRSSAGNNSSVATCNYGPFNLFDGLTGSVDLGGTWYDPSNTALPGALVTFNGQIAANYNYYYVVSNGVCPADTAYVEIQLQDCASIAENELTGFALYPNPTSDVINIQYSGTAINTEVILSDSKGSVILNEKVNFKTEDNYEIDMINLVKGVYFLNIYSESGSKVIRVVRN